MKVVIIIVLACVLEWIIRKILNVRKKAKESSTYNIISNYDNSTSVDESVNNDIVVIQSLDELKYPTKENEPLEKVIYNPNYQLPDVYLLDLKNKHSGDEEKIKNSIEDIEDVFSKFKIKAKIISVTIGPIYTLYEVEASKDTKLSKIAGLKREVSSALAKEHVKIQAPIPGKKTCGIEVNNDYVETVSFKDTIESLPKDASSNMMLIALGKDMRGEYKTCSIRKAPNILISGTTGSGKSVFIKNVIMNILMHAKPDEVKLILVDTKRIELPMFNGLPHLLCSVLTDPKKAALAFQKLVGETECRYSLFDECGVSDIESYNEWVIKENEHRSQDDKIEKLPYIIAVIDELYDMITVAGEETQNSIIRLAQMGRKAGIHLVISTQLPFADNVTKMIKANIPTRIAFMVATGSDSRAIIDMNGAEDLTGNGDMLFMTSGEKTPVHILGPYVSDDEIKRVVDFVCNQQKAQYDARFQNVKEEKDEYDDSLYNDAVEFVVTTGKASASLLQRRFKIEYNRAARIIDLLEERGIIGPMNGSKPRDVLVKLNNNSDDIDDEII